jgi:hypothetical protein
MKEIGIHITTVLWIMAIVVFVIGVANRCLAQDDDDTVLALAQCLAAECDKCDRGKEKEAIAWVLWKRMERYNANPNNREKRTYYEQVIRYCSVFDKRSVYYYRYRSRRIRAATIENQSHLTNADWLSLLIFSRRFVSPNERPGDPTPSAIHFSGLIDIRIALARSLVEVTRYCSRNKKWCTILWRRQ